MFIQQHKATKVQLHKMTNPNSLELTRRMLIIHTLLFLKCYKGCSKPNLSQLNPSKSLGRLKVKVSNCHVWNQTLARSKKRAQRLEILNLVNKTLLHISLSLYLISLLCWRKKKASSRRSLCVTFANPHIQQSYLANHIRRSMKHLPSPFMMGGRGMQWSTSTNLQIPWDHVQEIGSFA